MSMVNVRNLDVDVWRRFTAAARGRGTSVGALLTGVLSDWLRDNSTARMSSQERADRAVGMFAHIQPERCLSEELIADRRAEAAAEEAD